MNASVPCKVRSGLFSSELGVVVSSTEGDEYSFFTDKEFVLAGDQPIDGEEEVEGRVRVSVVRFNEEDQEALIQLPSGSSNMNRVWVPRDRLQTL